MPDLFWKGGEGAEYLLDIGRKLDPESKVTHGYVSQEYSPDSVEGF